MAFIHIMESCVIESDLGVYLRYCQLRARL